MNDSQINKAHKWYRDHYRYVNSLIDSIPDKKVNVAPSDRLDQNDPSLWKDIHWNWFLNFRKREIKRG